MTDSTQLSLMARKIDQILSEIDKCRAEIRGVRELVDEFVRYMESREARKDGEPS